MPLSPLAVGTFGGLRLNSDPEQVGLGAATDMLNVEVLEDRSQVQTRPGSLLIGNTYAGTPSCIAPVNLATATPLYMLATGFVSGAIFLDWMGSNGTRVSVGTWGGANRGARPPQIIQYGTTSSTLAFVAWSGVNMRKYDGTTLTVAAGAPGHIAVSPQSNRLVQAWFRVPAESPTAALGSPSTVFFSDPGDPGSYGANNYVHLLPGDGEEIVGMVTWRDLLFVFKESNAFVFYGESTDSTGQPVFNYRQFSLPSPINRSYAAVRVAVTGRGVYFTGADGVYRTTGGPPAKVSSALDGAIVSIVGNLSAVGDRVMLATGTDGSHYVYDERNDEWTFWKLPESVLAPCVGWPRAFPEPRQIVYAAGTSLLRTSAAATSDAGTAFVSRYRSGTGDLGSPNMKVMRELTADGTGNVNSSVAVDSGTQPTGTALTLGVSPLVGQGRSRVAARGRNFRVQFDATSGAWSLSRFVMNMRSGRPIGVKQ